MRNPLHTPFVTVFQNEVLLNSKRVAPYALMILFSANAVLWWFRGPAVTLGWATNSDFYIARGLVAFSFLLGLPIFNAVIMGDPVLRDFRTGVDPLIFSKPVSRAQYLLGKFFGNFFVLVCCQAVFPVTQLVLQAFPTSEMIVLPYRVFPYSKHFFFFLVITHLALAAFYFTVGSLTRNSKILYGLAACFYPLFITYGLILLRGLTVRGRHLLDPFQLNFGPSNNGFGHSAEFLNQYVVAYTADMIANRVFMILFAAGLLTILYVRFTIAERTGKTEKTSILSLSTAAEQVYYDSESFQETHGERFESHDSPEQEVRRLVTLPAATLANNGFRANVNKLIAAVSVEFNLLRAERSLLVFLPLAVLVSTLEVAFYDIARDVSFSAAYATNTAKLMLLFLFGMSVFYTAEAMHRDRELRIEPVLWSMPLPNSVLLLSKFLTTISLGLVLLVLVGLTAIATQILRGHTPVEISAYLITYSLVLFPTIVFVTAASIALSVLLRDKYVAYAVCIATGAGLVYFYNVGYNHWLYNPALYQLWTYSDLTGAGSGRILIHRIYWPALSSLCLALAQLGFRRKPAKGFIIDGRLGSTGWALLVLLVSAVVAVVTGLMIK